MPGANGSGFFLIWGQSNAVGFSDNGAGGTTAVTHAGPVGQSAGDSGLKLATAFPACTFAQHWQTAGSNPLNFTVVSTEGIQTYAAPGGNNCGIAIQFGRSLVRYGVYPNPTVIVCGIGSTSLPSNWAKTSGYPASGEKLYDHFVAFVKARIAEYGKQLDGIIQYGFETDSQTIGATSYASDHNSFYNSFRADIGQPTVPVWQIIINSEWDSSPFTTSAYQAAQVAWVAAEVAAGRQAFTFDPSWEPLAGYPHYRMGGYSNIGEALAIEVGRKYKPITFNPNQGAGPAPYYQGGSAAFTAQSGTGGSGTTARPAGYVDPKVGDIEILVAEGSPGVATTTLTTAAGFTSLIAQTDAINGGAHRSITVWKRTIDQTMLDARTAGADGVKRGPVATPVVDFGVNTLNVATIHSIRGASGQTVAPVTGTAASGNSVVIPTMTTTSNNSLILFPICCNGASGQVSNIVNANLTNLTVQRDSQFNPGAGVINYAVCTGIMPTAGATGSTTFTMDSINSVNVGAGIVFNP